MMKAKPLLALVGVPVVLAASFAWWLGSGGSWTASAQDTFIVNDDTTPTDGGCGAPDFQTEDIEDAIDSTLVGDGDTLIICEGTYNDAIEVTKSLTIEGRAAASRDHVVVQGSSGSHGFSVWADDVKIRHMNLVGPGTTGTDDGLHVEPLGPVTHERAEFSDLEITNWNRGVFIKQSNDMEVGSNNLIHGNAEGVVVLSGVLGGQRNRVFRNAIGPNQTGIHLPQTDEAYIQENVLSGNIVGPQILVTGESTVFIWSNTIEVTGNYGVYVNSPSADSLVQIGGSPEHANSFTGSLTEDFSYVRLECEAESTVDATFNYWNGISSSAGISAVVGNDEYDDPFSPTADCPGNDKGAVVVHPWLARTVDLSPPGWHDLAWSGADATDPANALACISGKYSIAYAWEGPTAGFKRYVEGCPAPGICNMGPLSKYDSLLVLIAAESVTCDMPVAPEPKPEPGDDGSEDLP